MTAAAAVAVSVLFKGGAHVLHEYVEYRVEYLFVVGAFEFNRIILVMNHLENDHLGVLVVIFLGLIGRIEYRVIIAFVGNNIQQSQIYFFFILQIDAADSVNVYFLSPDAISPEFS